MLDNVPGGLTVVVTKESEPEMAVLDLVDLMPTDELRSDSSCMMIIGLVVADKLSLLYESRDSEPEPGPEPGPELSWPEIAV